MILPCEVAVKSVVPAVKALMAQQLVEEYGMNQEQVAEILGISQSAVSKYFRKVRGHVIEVDKVQEARPLIASMVIMVVNGEHQRAEFLQSLLRGVWNHTENGYGVPILQKVRSENQNRRVRLLHGAEVRQKKKVEGCLLSMRRLFLMFWKE